jgi:hypothetical protein
MNRAPDVELVLNEWLAGDDIAPDRILEVVGDRIAGQPQRRTRRLQWRLQMTQLKFAAGLTAVIALAVLGYNLLPRQPSVGPQSTPSPTPSPTLTATRAAYQCENATSNCGGNLTAGSHSSTSFSPAVSYVVPDLWANSYDARTTYTFIPPSGSYSFQLMSQVAISAQTPDCTANQQTGVGNTVADWVTFFTTHPGLKSDPPVAITVGTFTGFKVHIQRAASWAKTCPGSLGPAIVTVMHAGHPELGDLYIDDQQETFFILDVAGQTVLMHVDSSPVLADHQRDLLSAQPVIDSMQFTP